MEQHTHPRCTLKVVLVLFIILSALLDGLCNASAPTLAGLSAGDFATQFTVTDGLEGNWTTEMEAGYEVVFNHRAEVNVGNGLFVGFCGAKMLAILGFLKFVMCGIILSNSNFE